MVRSFIEAELVQDVFVRNPFAAWRAWLNPAAVTSVLDQLDAGQLAAVVQLLQVSRRV